MKKDYEQNMKEIKELVNNSEHMIVITNTGYKIESDKLNLLSMLSTFINTLLENKTITSDDLGLIIEVAKMSKKDITRETNKILKNMLEKLKEDLKNE